MITNLLEVNEKPYQTPSLEWVPSAFSTSANLTKNDGSNENHNSQLRDKLNGIGRLTRSSQGCNIGLNPKMPRSAVVQ